MKQVGVLTNDMAEHIDVLDKGFVKFKDNMGRDWDITDAARVGHQGKQDWKKLLRYLIVHEHTSPFEMCEVKFHIKAPIFVARQIMRHRTANINEISGRYVEFTEEFYVPSLDYIQYQSTSNHQGRDEEREMDEPTAHDIQDGIDKANVDSYWKYKTLLEMGVAKEIARGVLTLNLYTEFYWKIDLHNLMHFLNLRMEKHAQRETRDYARAIATFVSFLYPETYKIYEELYPHMRLYNVE